MTSTNRSRRPPTRKPTSSRAQVSRRAADKVFKEIQLDPEAFPEIANDNFPDYPGMAVWYCEAVLAGKVPACIEEIQACKRFLDMRKISLTAVGAYYWSDAHIVDVCSFVEKLPHTKAFEGSIVLEPVQCWWLAGIFAFRERETGLRWVRSVSFWVPRKNAKSTLSVGVVLYCLLCENEPGAEATISAGSVSQAEIPYGMIRKTFELEPDLREHYGVHDTRDYTAFRKADAKITLATSKAKNLDGLNPHVVLAEELHAQSQEVIGVLRTAMGSRRNPLFLTISTAGRDVNAAAYEDWKFAKAVLEGRMRADRAFVVVYAASKEDADKRFDLRVRREGQPALGCQPQSGIPGRGDHRGQEERVEAQRVSSHSAQHLVSSRGQPHQRRGLERLRGQEAGPRCLQGLPAVRRHRPGEQIGLERSCLPDGGRRLRLHDRGLLAAREGAAHGRRPLRRCLPQVA